MRSDLVTQSALLLVLVVVALSLIIIGRTQNAALRASLPVAPAGDVDLTITHEHVCHVEHIYTDTTVPYPPTVYEATCDGATIKLYED